jgi:hypothetical protein
MNFSSNQRLLISALWPCFVTIISAILHLCSKEYDESSGMGSIVAMVIAPIIYGASLLLLVLFRIFSRFFWKNHFRFLVIFVIVLFAAALFTISNGSGSESLFKSLCISSFVSVFLLCPMFLFAGFLVSPKVK